MSFGYGAGDFLSVLLFANEIRRRFVYAPTHFKNTAEGIKSLSNVLRDIEDIDPENALSKSQRQQLEDISRSCCGVLQELHHLLARYQNLEMGPADPKATRGPRHFSRRAWQRLKWDPKEIEAFEQRIRGQVAIFNLFMSRLNIQINLAICETTTRSRDEIAAIKHFHSDDEFDKVLEWLSPVNYAAQQNDFLNQQQPGSGQWLLGASQFRGWLEGSNQTLFCPGIPGSGKTIMVSIIIDYLERAFKHGENIGIAYIYCSFRQRPSQTFRDLPASVVRQLVQRSLEIPNSMRTAYAQSRNKKIQPSVSELLQFLQVFSAQLSRVFIVVDALDECGSTARESFIAAIYGLENEHSVNLLATSRYIPDTIAAFEACPTLEIRATMEDVWRYLRSQLSRLPSFVSRNKDLQCEIIAEVSKAVGGMFLLAKLHLDSLVGKRSQKAVQMALKSLPSGSNAYDSAYSTAMERIEGQVSDQRDMAKQVLSWITCAGPLTTRELQHALAVEIGVPYLDDANISDVEDIVSVCAGLVIVDEQSNIIRLVHYTAQEYFERTWSSWFPCAQHNIAVTCITYLSYDFFKDYSSHSIHEAGVLDKYPLYRYAAQNWGRHGEIQRQDLGIMLDFLGNKQKATCAAQVLLEDSSWPIPKEVDGIHLASYFGLDNTVHELVMIGWDINLPDSLGKSPLSWAACEGHVGLVQLLLDLGASRDSMDTNWHTPLSWAAKTGQRDVVELLVNLGADKQSRDKYGQSPLSLAAKYGQRTVVEFLLKAGADVDSRDNNGQTALLWAANQDHPDIVRLLLENEDKMENYPVLSWSTTTVNEKEIDTVKFEDCEKDDPPTSGRDGAGNGRLMGARSNSQNGCLVIPLPRESTDDAVVDWTNQIK